MGNAPLKEIAFGAVVGGGIGAIICFIVGMPVISAVTVGCLIVGGLVGGTYGYIKSNGKNFGHKKIYQV